MTNDFKNKQSSGARPPRLSPEEYAAKKKAEKEAIYQLLDNTASEVVQSPEKFKAYLDVQSRMDRYTANNALLMYKQFPQASQIKEFDDWAAEGVKVNKGSKTFIILDPYEYTKKDGTIGIDFNLKRVLDVSQTNGKRPAAPTANRDPRKLVAVMLDSAPINIESVSELPYPDMGAFYKNEDQTLYVKRDIGDSVALCQCVAQELGHAELSMNSEVYSRKTADEMAAQYGFNEEQKEYLAELLVDENNSLWSQVLYGITGTDDQIVTVALSQIGNMGGEPYWSWYGFNSRVEWCACFVSWCANECGYIDAGVIPKYAGCVNGVQWFKDRGQWLDNSAEPAPGMIIFFDWADESGQDGLSDHTGIVQKVENGRVYTVEGNSGDSVRQNSYPVGYYEILGYGAPAY